jgi:hypothetical protein
MAGHLLHFPLACQGLFFLTAMAEEIRAHFAKNCPLNVISGRIRLPGLTSLKIRNL